MKKIKSKHVIVFEFMERKFLQVLAQKMHITSPKEWGRVTYQIINDNGGVTLLSHYKGSIFRMLKDMFPGQNRNALSLIHLEVEWNEEWFRLRTKTPTLQNRTELRQFMQTVAQKLHIKDLKDWGKVTNKQWIDNAVFGLIQKCGSAYKLLVHTFPGIRMYVLVSERLEQKWQEEWFTKMPQKEYWKIPQNQKKFLEDLTQKYQIKEQKDWRRIGILAFAQRGASGLLRIYGNSFYQMLRSNYPGILFLFTN